MSKSLDPDWGKCKSCGFLSKRTIGGGYGSFPATDYEATPDERKPTAHFFNKWHANGHHSTVDVTCFRGIADLPNEYQHEVDESAKTRAAMEVLDRDRKCNAWSPYKHGFNPMQHYEWHQEEQREKRWEDFQKWMENGRRDFEERNSCQLLALHKDLSERETKMHIAIAESQKAFVLERDKIQEPTSKLMKRLTFVGIVLASIQVIAAIAALTDDSFMSRFMVWLWRR